MCPPDTLLYSTLSHALHLVCSSLAAASALSPAAHSSELHTCPALSDMLHLPTQKSVGLPASLWCEGGGGTHLVFMVKERIDVAVSVCAQHRAEAFLRSTWHRSHSLQLSPQTPGIPLRFQDQALPLCLSVDCVEKWPQFQHNDGRI